ncbi:hypothetical protein SKAU_G00326850 [Synaphobranchus kaupii]|uniref:Uncharacterized protein n=1 Tax=Synaphobranchus kaupii TaxID=118154 RepID=A0A9Q1EPY0_SYNKA|nr:hypothetical protein SKAU_G00326850 [Synaphobranchus kaupii]
MHPCDRGGESKPGLPGAKFLTKGKGSIQISTAWLPRLDPLLDTRPRHLHRYCNQHFKRDQEPSKEQ